MAEWAIALAVLMLAIGQLIRLEAGSRRVEMVMLVLWVVALAAFLAICIYSVKVWWT